MEKNLEKKKKRCVYIYTYTHTYVYTHMGFAGGSVVKNLPANATDVDSIPGLGRSPGEGNGHSLHYSCLENLMDRGAWQATAHGVTKSWTLLTTTTTTHTHTHTRLMELLFYTLETNTIL